MPGLLSLVLTIGSSACALPLAHVIETMRPLAIEPMANMPAFVLGVSIVRGTAVPVVSVAALLGGATSAPRRFVTIRVGARTVALAVDGVEGIANLDASTFEGMPPLLQHAGSGAVEAIAPLDDRLLFVLRAMRMIPEPAT